MMYDSYGGMGTFGWLVMVLVWVLLVVAIVWALRELFTGGDRQPSEPPEPRVEDPFAILDRRLASGEIDPEAYHELRDKLDESRLIRRR
jgi:putative membrane protein